MSKIIKEQNESIVLPGGIDVNNIFFMCPGCHRMHSVPAVHGLPVEGKPVWGWNGNIEEPSIDPSIRTWGTNETTGEEFVCHSVVRLGTIEFFADSSHELAGKTVPLPDI